MKSWKKVKYYLSFCLFIQTALIAANEKTVTYLKVGELSTISFPKGSKFALSSNKILSVKVDATKQQLLIKAKRSGEAFVTILAKSSKEFKKHSFFIAKNQGPLSLEQAMAELKASNFRFQKIGHKIIKIIGKINDREQYRQLYDIQKRSKKYISIQAELEQSLKLKVLTNIYKTFLFNEIESINCQFENFVPDCTVSKIENGIDQIKNNLQQIHPIKIAKINSLHDHSTYKLYIKVIQIDSNINQERESGLNNLSLKLDEAIQKNFNSLLENRNLHIQDLKSDIHVIAEPIIKFIPGKKAKIQIGSQVQQAVINQNGLQGQEWKFFGIDINVLIKKFGENFQTDYAFNFSTPPTQGRANTNFNKSTTTLSLGQLTKLFHFKLKSSLKENTSIPILGSIPIIGSLFQNDSDTLTNKNIFIYAQVLKEGESI